MIEFEDILDDVTRYIDGNMSLQERDFFEELLRQNPYLQKDMRFMELVSQGLIEVEQREKANSKLGKRKPVRQNFPLQIALIASLLLLIGLIYWGGLRKSQTIPQSTPFPLQVENDSPSEPGAYIYFDKLGGEGENDNSDRGHGICWLPNGEVAFSGTFEGSGIMRNQIFRSRGKKDIIFGNFNTHKGITWVETIGSENDPDFAKDIVSDSKSNLILTGSLGQETYFQEQIVRSIGKDDFGNRDFFIAKLDPRGKLLWVDHAGGIAIDHKQTGVNSGFALATDKADNVIVSGIYIGSPKLAGNLLPVGGPNDDLFLAKYSPGGSLQWVNTVTGNYMIYGHDVATDTYGNVFVTGAYGHHNYSGWAQFGSDTILNSRGGRDIFLAKYKPDGSLVWARSAGSNQSTNGQESSNGVAVDSRGNSVITGTFVGQAFFDTQALVTRGGRDLFLAKYSPEGNLLWANRAGSAHGDGKKADKSYAIAISADESIVITGCFAATADFDTDTLSTTGNHNLFVAKYDPQGKILWTVQFEAREGFLEAEGNDLDINNSGDIVVTGYFSGTIGIGDWELKSEGREDIFILVLNKDGEVLSARKMIANRETKK